MKSLKWFALIVMAGLLLVGNASADEYPSHPINGYIAWGAGGGTDTVSRLVTPLAEKTLGQSVILANKTGATGAIATMAAFRGKADGYTLLFHAENPMLYQVLGLSELSYDEFDPIMLFVQGSTVIVVPKDSPIKTYDDLIKAAKANPGKLSIGISGVGGQPWVTSKLIKKVEGAEFNSVAYNGDGPLVTALLGGQLDVSGLAVGAAVQYVKNGDLRALAIMKDGKNLTLPEVPPITEINPEFKDVMRASGFFYGVFVKKGTPQPVIDKLVTAYRVAIEDPKFRDYAQLNGLSIMGYTGEKARTFMNDWRSLMSWLIWESGAGKNNPEKFGIPKI